MLLAPLVLALVASYARATALTAVLTGNERSCYYADVDGVGEKVGAYRSCSLLGPSAQSTRLLLCGSIRWIVRHRLRCHGPGRQGAAGGDRRETG